MEVDLTLKGGFGFLDVTWRRSYWIEEPKHEIKEGMLIIEGLFHKQHADAVVPGYYLEYDPDTMVVFDKEKNLKKLKIRSFFAKRDIIAIHGQYYEKESTRIRWHFQEFTIKEIL